jgi:outer membrane protein TolC
MNRSFALVAFLLLLTCMNAASQQIPANRNRPSDPLTTVKVNAANSTALPDSVVEKKLVELAIKSPAYSASNHQSRINELELKKAKNAWLNLLSISTNYNDQSFAKTNASAPIVYPKYFFGVTIPLGMIFSQGTQVKTAREAVAYSKDQQEILIRTLKADILGKYKEYKLYNVLLEMQSELINDVLANATEAEDNFKKGTITVEAYISALKTRNDEVAKKMNLELQQDLIKLEIEKIIGIPLEQVLNPGPVAATK